MDSVSVISLKVLHMTFKLTISCLKTEVDEYVIKAQVHAGGRGKGHFDTGFKSGVHILKE